MAQTGVAVAEFGDADVRLEFEDGGALRAKLVVGAEGAESSLRTAAGIDVAGWSYDATAVVCHFATSRPHRGEALQRFLEGGPIAFLPLADGRRSLVWSAPREEANALLALDDATFARRLEEAVQDEVGPITAPTRRLAFPLRLQHAQRYVANRFALVGDAAHVIHPLAGQGLNLGLADADVLANELAAARSAGRDWTSLRTLSRYERARQAENLEMMALTDGLHRAFALSLPGAGTLLSRGLSLVDRLAPVKRALIRRAQG
jgi:ubiquinone biosynthesis UbiH/UbiF/VisC/COQ6 family hydroxylase